MKKRFSEEKIIPILKEAEAGIPAKELLRKYEISDATFYTWRKKYGGMKVSEARRLKSLEKDNTRLKKLLAESMLDAEGLRRLSDESTDCQGQARCRAHNAIEYIDFRAQGCSLVRLPRATMRYQFRPSLTDIELTERIMILAHERRHFGYRRTYRVLRREGIMVNRLYKEAGLTVRKRKKRKEVIVDYSPLVRSEQVNQAWSMDVHGCIRKWTSNQISDYR